MTAATKPERQAGEFLVDFKKRLAAWEAQQPLDTAADEAKIAADQAEIARLQAELASAALSAVNIGAPTPEATP